MSKSRKYILSVEVLKYPYCGKRIESKEFLSEKIIKKSRWLVIYGSFIFSLKNGEVLSQIGTPIFPPTPPIMTSIHSNTDLSKKVVIARVSESISDKVIFTEKQMDQFYDLAVKYMNNSITREELLTELRGGDIKNLVGAMGIIMSIIIILNNSYGFDPVLAWFIPPNRNLYRNQNPGNSNWKPFQPSTESRLEIARPSEIPHPDFVAFTPEERRQIPNENDMIMKHEGHAELRIGFWQARYKVPDHGAVHELPYTVKAKGQTKTEKTDKNTLEMMRSIFNMPNRDNIKWFDDGRYQANTDREFEAIHIFDRDTNVIATFRKNTGNFVTTCQLEEEEVIELEATGNFGGGKGWFSGQVKNFPPKDFTPVNTFESDVMGITPISPMDENPSSNEGFTPSNSFESDVMGITPVDNSQVDKDNP